MGKLKVAGLMAVILALSSFSLLGKHQDDKDKKQKPQKKVFVDYQQGFFNEQELRRDALVTVTPDYPEEAITAGAQGIAQVAVLFDENGDYVGMKVLESPHRAISKAMADALKQWKVKIGYDSPDPATRLPVRVFAQVQFHFTIRDGVASVEAATSEEQNAWSQKFTKIAGIGKDRVGW